jgi:hypothetical protein
MKPKRGVIRNTVLLRRHQKGGIALQRVAQIPAPAERPRTALGSPLRGFGAALVVLGQLLAQGRYIHDQTLKCRMRR